MNYYHHYPVNNLFNKGNVNTYIEPWYKRVRGRLRFEKIPVGRKDCPNCVICQRDNDGLCEKHRKSYENPEWTPKKGRKYVKRCVICQYEITEEEGETHEKYKK